uniref:Leucine-rich repeat-containing N-terminal plant-type domain-containing protein n=1 Tax=Oryza nivara TaxID=4536 RepID=A0A0E0G1I5_ORYNI
MSGELPLALGNFSKPSASSITTSSAIFQVPYVSLRDWRSSIWTTPNISGELPSALGNCTSLKTISIKHNNCIGDIPDSIDWRSTIWATPNMSGKLPSALGNCTSLKTISIKHNFIGDIPGSIGQIKRLEELHLD